MKLRLTTISFFILTATCYGQTQYSLPINIGLQQNFIKSNIFGSEDLVSVNKSNLSPGFSSGIIAQTKKSIVAMNFQVSTVNLNFVESFNEGKVHYVNSIRQRINLKGLGLNFGRESILTNSQKLRYTCGLLISKSNLGPTTIGEVAAFNDPVFSLLEQEFTIRPYKLISNFPFILHDLNFQANISYLFKGRKSNYSGIEVSCNIPYSNNIPDFQISKTQTGQQTEKKNWMVSSRFNMFSIKYTYQFHLL